MGKGFTLTGVWHSRPSLVLLCFEFWAIVKIPKIEGKYLPEIIHTGRSSKNIKTYFLKHLSKLCCNRQAEGQLKCNLVRKVSILETVQNWVTFWSFWLVVVQLGLKQILMLYLTPSVVIFGQLWAKYKVGRNDLVSMLL